MPTTQTRRRVLAMLPLAGACSLVRAPAVWAAEERLETTSVRLQKVAAICLAPQYLAGELLRAEGFTDVRYVLLPPGTNTPDAIDRGIIDFGANYAPVQIAGVDRGVGMTMLSGVEVGCFELFVRSEFRGITDLKGKSVGIEAIGSYDHWFLSVIVATVGLNPHTDIRWVTAAGPVTPKQLFIDGKIDAFLGVPPDPEELRAQRIGRVVVNSSLDNPWSQYFCCVLAGSNDYIRAHPVATKRVLRAILKAADFCVTEPAAAARRLVKGKFTKNYDFALRTIRRDVVFDKWREYDAEDTIRFYALRLRDIGIIKTTPQKIIAEGTDWRFLNELKLELKA
jgi:NitT/TauT family transport system substrate-binding protein